MKSPYRKVGTVALLTVPCSGWGTERKPLPGYAVVAASAATVFVAVSGLAVSFLAARRATLFAGGDALFAGAFATAVFAAAFFAALRLAASAFRAFANPSI